MNSQQTVQTFPFGEVSNVEGKSKNSKKGASEDMPLISQQPHVLVVDDDRRLRMLLREFLTENGFLVATAGDAADARGKLRYLDFDALVLDVMMPGESGIDLMRALRSKGNIPILLLTAMDEVDDRIAGLEGGADDYLAKPFHLPELLLRVKGILRRWEWYKEPVHDQGIFQFVICGLTLSAAKPKDVLVNSTLRQKKRC